MNFYKLRSLKKESREANNILMHLVTVDEACQIGKDDGFERGTELMERSVKYVSEYRCECISAVFQCGGGNVVRTRCLPAALLLEQLPHLVLLSSEGRREWHSRVGQADGYRRRILTIEAGVEVVEIIRYCGVKARGGRLVCSQYCTGDAARQRRYRLKGTGRQACACKQCLLPVSLFRHRTWLSCTVHGRR